MSHLWVLTLLTLLLMLLLLLLWIAGHKDHLVHEGSVLERRAGWRLSEDKQREQDPVPHQAGDHGRPGRRRSAHRQADQDSVGRRGREDQRAAANAGQSHQHEGMPNYLILILRHYENKQYYDNFLAFSRTMTRL